MNHWLLFSSIVSTFTWALLAWNFVMNRRLHKTIHKLRSMPTAIIIRGLEIALEESVKLQSHYAKLLNMHDGGRRMQFAGSKEWIDRLRATSKIAEADHG
jgi:hypothetical protein